MEESADLPEFQPVDTSLGPGGGGFVPDQIVLADEFYPHPRDLNFHPAGEAFVKGNSIDSG